MQTIITKAQWTKMNKNRRRVYLAKDIIAQLDSGKFVERHMQYIGFSPPGEYYRNIANYYTFDSVQKIINDEDRTCYVCAKGAFACSYISKFNKYSVGNFLSHESGNIPELVKLFGEELWNKIEILFEGFLIPHNTKVASRQYSMKEIMKNLIQNKGKDVTLSYY